jgi:hypothetical protein
MPGRLDVSAGGACSKREVGDDDDDDEGEKSNSRHAHQPGVSDVSRSPGFDAGDGGNGSDEDGETKPSEPSHDG